MSSNILTQYQEDLTFDQAPKIKGKTLWQQQNGKHIYRNGNQWVIRKSINGKNKYFGGFQDFPTAMRIRDQLMENGWDETGVEFPIEYVQREKEKEYYKYISIGSGGRYYYVADEHHNYLGSCRTIEEALYYRDLTRGLPKDKVRRPKDYDLTINNPYLEDGLLFPLPERLKLTHKKRDGYGAGRIVKKHPQSYHIYHGSKTGGRKDYVCACRTYEHAYYVREKMNECGWDNDQLPRILEEYPVWYTWVVNLYRFISPYTTNKGKRLWKVAITPKNNEEGKLEHLTSFSRLEDALYERDLLVQYNYDEDLIVECADYSKNPYYDMDLPPYPERKIRRIKEREDRTDLFNDLYDILLEEPDLSQEEFCEMACVSVVSLKNILRNEFGITITDFRRLIQAGEHPNDVLEQKPLIYNPNLERDYGGTHIGYFPERKSPYAVLKWIDGKTNFFGQYPTRELAEKIVKDLKQCNWDKSQLRKIQAKHGHVPMMMSKRWVYANKRTSKRTGKVKVYSYSVRHKDKDKRMIGYGTYKDKRVAELVRDLLILYDWDKANLCWIQDLATYTIEQADNNWRCRL